MGWVNITGIFIFSHLGNNYIQKPKYHLYIGIFELCVFIYLLNMEKYYILQPAVGNKETGMAYPAVESYDDYDFKGINSVYNLSSDKFPDFIPEIRFKLAKKAKLCDVMGQATISACGLLISQNIKDIFERFNLIPHKYYNATIETKGIFHQYFWAHFVWEEGINFLDFKNSKFKIKRASKDLGSIEINSLADLHSKQAELGFINMIHNYEYTFLNPGYDLFIHPLNKTIFISDRLNNQLINCKGLEITIAKSLKML